MWMKREEKFNLANILRTNLRKMFMYFFLNYQQCFFVILENFDCLNKKFSHSVCVFLFCCSSWKQIEVRNNKENSFLFKRLKNFILVKGKGHFGDVF